MNQIAGGESLGPLAEKTYGPGFINSLRKMARAIIGPKYEPIDLSDLNDENDPPGLALTPGGPTTRRELLAHVKELQDSGVAGPLTRDRGYGFRPVVDRSTTRFAVKGAPIVDAARGLRDRQEGRIPLNSGVVHPEARKLIEEVGRQRGQSESRGKTALDSETFEVK